MDGTMLSAHQVDALSGTLIALTVGDPRPRRQARQRPGARVEELPSGEVELEGDDELDRRGAARLGSAPRRPRRRRPPTPGAEDPGAARRFWFEHATGAGKTVAALGFVEASRTGGVLILTHRRNLVDQFLGELRDRGYRKRICGAAARRTATSRPPAGP